MAFDIAFLNDKFLPLSEIGISPMDLGIQRGYGVFDFFKIKQLKNPWLQWYLDRLQQSCQEADLNLNLSNEKLTELIGELLRQNHVMDGAVKIIVTGGISTDGYTKPQKTTILMIGMPHTLPKHELYFSGTRLITTEYKRDVPHVKTTNYLHSISILKKTKKMEAIDVLYHWNGSVSESSRCNFFGVFEDRIVTPGQDVLEGITRKRVLSLEDRGLLIDEDDIRLHDLPLLREAFITSTTKGVMPVVQIDQIRIGNGRVGEKTKRLMELINVF